MEDITDVDYRHAKRGFKVFNNKCMGHFHDLYVQSDTLLLADVFEINAWKYKNVSLFIFYLHQD